MTRIVTVAGVVLAFSLVVFLYLTAGAATGDILCARPPAVAGTATPTIKSALAAAINATAPGLTPSELDWALCGQRMSNPGQWYCSAGEEKTYTDSEWALADLAGAIGAGTETAASIKKYGPVRLSEGAKTTWDVVTQAAFSAPLDGVRWFKFWRSDPGDKTVVSMQWEEIVALTPTEYRAARTSDPPTCGRGFGIVD